MKRRLFTALAALTVISTVASPIAVADTPDQSVPGDNVQTRPRIDDSSLHPAGVRLLVPDILKNAQDGVFIVRLAEDSVATYKGGVAGF